VTTSGAVSIPGVPSGPFWLRFQRPTDSFPTFLDTSGGAPVDLGYDQLGRSTVTRPTASTQVTFALNGVGNWATADQMQLASSNADVWDWLSRVNGSNFRDNFFTPNTTGSPLDLIRTGDLVTIYRMVSATDTTSARTYRAARTKGDGNTINLTSGSAATINGYTLSATGLTNGSLAGGPWSLTTFEGLRGAMNLPAGAGATHSLSVAASVGTLTGNGPVPRNAPPTLFTMTIAGPAAANVTVGSGLTYARVLDTTRWNEWRGVDFTGSVPYTATGATNAATATVSVGRREAVSATTPLAPTLTPVTGLTVTPASGLPLGAYVAQTGVGLTPTISWSPPVTGTATSYTLEVFRLVRSGTNLVNTTITPVATFVTGSTQVAIPTGVLTAGSAHFVRVTARAIPSDPWATAPLRRIVLGAWAQALSGPLTP
jgi:hypothetical protein